MYFFRYFDKIKFDIPKHVTRFKICLIPCVIYYPSVYIYNLIDLTVRGSYAARTTEVPLLLHKLQAASLPARLHIMRHTVTAEEAKTTKLAATLYQDQLKILSPQSPSNKMEENKMWSMD